MSLCQGIVHVEDFGRNDAVVLRGLTIEGAGVGANGVVFNAGGSLLIASCFIQGFAGGDENHGNGILFQVTTFGDNAVTNMHNASFYAFGRY